MDDEEPIRSYHRAFTGELTLHSIGDIRLWREVPARGIFWLAGLELLAFLLYLLPPFSLIPWEIQFFLGPLVLAWLFTVGSIEGRRFHVAAHAASRHAFRGRRFVGTHRPLKAEGETWRPGRIRVGVEQASGSPRCTRGNLAPAESLRRYAAVAAVALATLAVPAVLLTAATPAARHPVVAASLGAPAIRPHHVINAPTPVAHRVVRRHHQVRVVHRPPVVRQPTVRVHRVAPAPPVAVVAAPVPAPPPPASAPAAVARPVYRPAPTFRPPPVFRPAGKTR